MANDGAPWTIDGKTVVITGGNSGIGFETAVALATMGARTLITARNAERGKQALEDIKERSGSDQVALVVFDLASLASVRAGAAEILARCPQLHVLVNNAGLVLSKRQVTVDGYEATLAINHLGPFLLTELLLDRLRESAPSRIVNVSSTAHAGARRGMRFDDLQTEHGYRAMSVYGRSKLANILFTKELARRLEGTGVTANCLHPGLVATGYGHDGDTSGILEFSIDKLARPFSIDQVAGAKTSVYLASSPDLDGVSGLYFVRSKPKQPKRQALDEAAAKQLWDVSEQLVAQPAGSAA
ncbi:MAG TPA: SDR family oxidoreductase [Acidimicrobiales bacterium]|nr:SDR family oxidoreductase [Acidimicrobiales bacterium]